MEIIKLIPNGFCYGVITAYKNTLSLIENNKSKKIYMLGWLVHNQKVIDELIQRNVIILDDDKETRLEIINKFDDNLKDSILILSAHGTDHNVIKIAKDKGFIIYDYTCKFVYKTHNIIKEKIDNDYEIIFIGKKNHPETNAILKINNKIILIENEDDINRLNINKTKIFCTNQTTISQYQFSYLLDLLKLKFNNIEFQNDICDATKVRQDAIINMPKDVDICIVIGDNKSSNSNELYNLSKKIINDSYIINDVYEINNSWFKNKKKCAITAGASTPANLIVTIISEIERLNNE